MSQLQANGTGIIPVRLQAGEKPLIIVMDHAQKLAALAAEYCTLIEQREKHSAKALLKAVHRLLPHLYACAMELKPIGTEESADVREITPEEWHELYRSLEGQFGLLDFYRDIFDPHDGSSEPVLGSLADDLADTYRDLKNGLVRWEQGLQHDAVNCWEENFRIHWSEHASGAIRALRWLEFNHGMTRSEADLDKLLDGLKRSPAVEPTASDSDCAGKNPLTSPPITIASAPDVSGS